MNDTPEGIQAAADYLIAALTTNAPEFVDGYSDNPDNWQANMARRIASQLLYAASADGLGGCSLCQL